MSGTHRLAAILAAEVAGCSRPKRANEAGTAKIVRERREAATPIARGFGGRLVKTVGDGVLLEFASVMVAQKGCGRQAHRHGSARAVKATGFAGASDGRISAGLAGRGSRISRRDRLGLARRRRGGRQARKSFGR